MACDIFNESAENQQNWAIRYGAEPVDAHMTGLSNDRGEIREPGLLSITAGPMGVTNHNYIDFGVMDGDQFCTLKRVQALALDENLTMLDPANSRLFGFVIDGKYNTFEKDDMVLADDPHHERARDFQHADVQSINEVELLFGNDESDDYTRVVFEGSERQVLQVYSAVVAATVEINNQDPDFSMFGDLSWNWLVGESPNSNTFNAELKDVASQVAGHLNIELAEHNPWGWDIGATADMLETSAPTLSEWGSLDELRGHVDQLEQAAAQQWKQIQEQGIHTNLETTIPTTPTGGGLSP